MPTELAFLGGLAALRLAAASPTCQVEALACEWLGIPATLLVWVSVAYPPTAAVSWALVRGARMGLRRAALAL